MALKKCLWPRVPSFGGTAYAPLAVSLSCTKVKGFSNRRSQGLVFWLLYRPEQIKRNWHVQGSCLRNVSMSPNSLTAMLFVADSPELWLDPDEGHSAGCLSVFSLWAGEKEG